MIKFNREPINEFIKLLDVNYNAYHTGVTIKLGEEATGLLLQSLKLLLRSHDQLVVIAREQNGKE